MALISYASGHLPMFSAMANRLSPMHSNCCFPTFEDPSHQGFNLRISPVLYRRSHRRLGLQCPIFIACSSRQSESTPTRKPQNATRKYSFWTDNGFQIMAFVSKSERKHELVLEVPSIPILDGAETLRMHWGIFQSDSTNWIHLDPGSVPSGTEFPSGVNNAMKTAFKRGKYGAQTLELVFDSEHIPFFISFVLYQPPSSAHKEHWIRNSSGSFFCIPIGLGQGKPYPLGLTIQSDCSTNFALYSRNAENVILCLYDSKTTKPSLELDLHQSIHRTGDVWHVEFDSLMDFHYYGYRCKGAASWEKGNRYQSQSVLLDPYAKFVTSSKPAQEFNPSHSKLLGSIIKETTNFNWEGDLHPELPLESLIAYRMNVTGFTADKSSGLDKNLRGTFEGVAEKVAHLQRLGVNAIILQPIFAFDENKGCFYPFSFFAPMDRFGPAYDSVSATISLKKMVKRLHKAGIEVILDVVYSQTGEDGDEEPKSVSFRGIDNGTYYILTENNKVAGSGFGLNLFNCNNPVVHSLILDSLRHWVVEYHIDGFCFVNADALTIGPHEEELSRPLLVEGISFDPILARKKIMADSCSSLKEPCKSRSFPHWKRWCQWNGLYRDDVRKFLRGDKGQLSNFATRICGSGDQFANGRGPSYSINFIAGPYGLTLVDLVSYSKKGLADTDFSWNCGEEGRTSNQEVLETRVKQVHNFLLCLFISQGIPVINMGDECGFSKGGSTPISKRWTLNWNAVLTDFGIQITQWISLFAAFRTRRKDLLQRSAYVNLENMKWHGLQPDQPQWESLDSSFLAVTLHPENDLSSSRGDLYIGFNCQQEVSIAFLPKTTKGMIWHRIADTSLPYPENFIKDGVALEHLPHDESSFRTYEFQPNSCVLLEAREAAK